MMVENHVDIGMKHIASCDQSKTTGCFGNGDGVSSHGPRSQGGGRAAGEEDDSVVDVADKHDAGDEFNTVGCRSETGYEDVHEDSSKAPSNISPSTATMGSKFGELAAMARGGSAGCGAGGRPCISDVTRSRFIYIFM
jgi:hypothetical protein